MANNGVHFNGLEELKQFFDELPDELTDEANAIVIEIGESAKQQAENAYPSEGENTGNLKRGVRLKVKREGHKISATLTNLEPHSHLYELGTEMRQTSKGANRGRMPARPVIRRIAPQKRREMRSRLIQMVREKTGAEVTDE